MNEEKLHINRYGAVSHISEIEAVLSRELSCSKNSSDKCCSIPVKTMERLVDSAVLLKLYIMDSVMREDEIYG